MIDGSKISDRDREGKQLEQPPITGPEIIAAAGAAEPEPVVAKEAITEPPAEPTVAAKKVKRRRTGRRRLPSGAE